MASEGRWPSGAWTPVMGGPGIAPPAPAAGPSPLALLRAVLDSATLPAAAQALASALALHTGCERVAVGLRRDGRTELLAGADSAARHGETAQRLVAAMDEALAQAVPLRWPAAPGTPQASHVPDADGADPALPLAEAVATAATLAHRAWQQAVGGAVACVPLGRDGEPFGAVAFERRDGPAFGDEELAALESALAAALPALHWVARAAEPWPRRLRRAAWQGLQALRQPERRAARRIAAAAAAALLGAALLPLEHTVGGRARIEGGEQRVLVAPGDGFVKTVHARPGDRVRRGDPLVDLLDSDLRLEHERWASQLLQHENAYASAMARSDRASAAASLARLGEAQAQLALVEQQLLRGRVVAPFDGLVIDGDLTQAVGAPVRQGDRLLTVAAGDRHRVVVEVGESDIARVQPGQGGRLAVSALPWQHQDLVVERITPLARAVDGRNVFEVQARLDTAHEALRPGLLGRAELVVGRRPPLWAWLGGIADRLRLSWWAWLG